MASLGTLHSRQAFVDRQLSKKLSWLLLPVLGMLTYLINSVIGKIFWPMRPMEPWSTLVEIFYWMILLCVWAHAIFGMVGMSLRKRIDKQEAVPLRRIKLSVREPETIRNAVTPKLRSASAAGCLELCSIVQLLLESRLGGDNRKYSHMGISRDIHNAIMALRRDVFGVAGSNSVDGFGSFKLVIKYNPVEAGRVEYVIGLENGISEWSRDGIFFIRTLSKILPMTVGNLHRVTDGRLVKEKWIDEQEESQSSAGEYRGEDRRIRLPVW